MVVLRFSDCMVGGAVADTSSDPTPRLEVLGWLALYLLKSIVWWQLRG